MIEELLLQQAIAETEAVLSDGRKELERLEAILQNLKQKVPRRLD